MTAKPDLFIGIDSGTHTGIAVWIKPKQTFELIKTVPIHVAMEMVRERKDRIMLVRVEDPRQRGAEKLTRFDPESVKKYVAKLQGVGSVKRDASIWEDFLTDLKIPFDMCRPGSKITKWTPEYFKTVTKYTGRTTNHSRDAAMLIYGY
jgi:hypothetical protein